MASVVRVEKPAGSYWTGFQELFCCDISFCQRMAGLLKVLSYLTLVAPAIMAFATCIKKPDPASPPGKANQVAVDALGVRSLPTKSLDNESQFELVPGVKEPAHFAAQLLRKRWKDKEEKSIYCKGEWDFVPMQTQGGKTTEFLFNFTVRAPAAPELISSVETCASPRKFNLVVASIPVIRDRELKKQIEIRAIEALYNSIYAAFALAKERTPQGNRCVVHSSKFGAEVSHNNLRLYVFLHHVAAHQLDVDIIFHGFTADEIEKCRLDWRGCIDVYDPRIKPETTQAIIAWFRVVLDPSQAQARLDSLIEKHGRP